MPTNKSRPDRIVADFLGTYSGSSPQTVRTYRSVLLGYIGWRRGPTIDRRSYDQYIGWLRANGRKQNHIAKVATALRSYAKFRKVRIEDWQVPPTKWTATDTMSIPEVQLLREAAVRCMDPESGLFLVNFLSETGLRSSEFLGLRWVDIDVAGQAISVREAKGGESRSIPMTPGATEATLRWGRIKFGRKETATTLRLHPEFVWPPRDSRVLRRRIEFIARAARLDVRGVHLHMFRHTAATLARNAGVDERGLQAFLGHKSLQTTARYGTVNTDRAREILRAKSLAPPPSADEEGSPRAEG